MKNKKIFNFVMSTLNGYKKQLFFYMMSISFLFHIIPMFILPYIFSLFGNKFQSKTLTVEMSVILSIIYVVFFSLTPLLRVLFIERQLWYGVILKVANKFRENLFEYVLKQSVGYYDNTMSGVIANKISTIAGKFPDFFNIGTELVSSIIMTVVSLIIYIKIDFNLSLIFILWSILFLFLYCVFAKINYLARKTTTAEVNKINGMINDSIGNITNIKSFSTQNYEKKEIKKQGIIILQKVSNELKKEGVSDTVFGLLNFILMLSIMSYSFYLTFTKQIMVGTFIFICQNIMILSGVLLGVFENTKIVTQMFAEMKDGFETLLEDIEIKDGKDLLKINNAKIKFKNITFEYKN